MENGLEFVGSSAIEDKLQDVRELIIKHEIREWETPSRN